VYGRYLYVEWEDPVFGPRAAAVHRRLQEALCASDDATHALAAISAQMGLVAQLRHIASELKAALCPHPPDMHASRKRSAALPLIPTHP
jgi:hypothetical protein